MSGSSILMVRACTVAGLSLAAAACVSGQPTVGTVAGVVRARDSGTPISGAIIEIRTLGLRATSDSSGAFRIAGLEPGDVRLNLRALGFHAIVLVVNVRRDTTSVVDVTIEPVPLPAAEIESGLRRGDERMRGFYQRRDAGFGRFVTRADIDRREVMDTRDLLRGMPGVRLVGSRIQMASSMSSPRCMVQYFVDAIHVTGAPTDFLSQFRPRDIEGMEVYRGPAETPPEFSRGGAECGVIVIWTRTPGGRR